MKPLVVESTTLITIAYDLDHLVLQLEFRDRTIYHYFDVPVDVFSRLGQRVIEGQLLQSLYPRPVRTYTSQSHGFLILALMGAAPLRRRQLPHEQPVNYGWAGGLAVFIEDSADD